MKHSDQVRLLIHACRQSPRLVEEADTIITRIVIGNYRGDLQKDTVAKLLCAFREAAENEQIHLQSVNNNTLYDIIRHIAGCRDFT